MHVAKLWAIKFVKAKSVSGQSNQLWGLVAYLDLSLYVSLFNFFSNLKLSIPDLQDFASCVSTVFVENRHL